MAGIWISRRGVAGVAALCGSLAAFPYLMASSGSPGWILLVYFSQLPLFAAGLWQGVSASALAGLAGAVILVAGGDMLTAAAFAGLNAVPVVLLVRRSLLARTGVGGAIEWYPPGLMAAWLTGLGLATIVVTLLLFGGLDGMRAGVREVLAPALDGNLDEKTSQHEEIFGFIAFIVPGIIAASWMVMTTSNGSLAQGLLARFGANWRPSPDLAALSLPVWIPVLLALAVGATLLGGLVRFVAVNVMIVLAVPFCLAGLAVIHTLARRLSRPAIPLVTFYVLVGVFGWPLLLVALLGVLESLLGLWRRLAQPSASEGIR